MVWPAFPQCLEGYSRETGSVVNKIQCRIREYVDGTRNVTSAWEVRYAEIWPRMRVWKKKRIFEIAMKKVWDARSGPSFPDPTNLLLFFLSCALPFAVYCFGQFSVQNLCQTALELQSELSDCSCILSWSHSTIWHDILALTNLQGFTKNKISHQHKQATFLFLRVKTVFQLTSSFRPCGSFSKPGDWVWKCSNQKETEYFDIPTSNVGSAVKTRPPQLHHLFNFSSTLPFLAFNVPPFLELHKVMRYTCF